MTQTSTMQLDVDTSDGCVSLIVYEVTWPDNEPPFLFMKQLDAINCAARERPMVKGVVESRYVL